MFFLLGSQWASAERMNLIEYPSTATELKVTRLSIDDHTDSPSNV